MTKRVAAFFLAFFWGCFFIVSMVKGAENNLTLQEVRTLAIENSQGVENTKIDLIKKQIELKQAKEAIADTIKKENTIRFSLLFNIKFPEKHGMPKEIELLTSVPEIENDIVVLEKKKQNEMLQSQTAAEQAYYDVLLTQYKQRSIVSRLEELKEAEVQLDRQVKLGTGKKSDLEYIQDRISALEKERARNIVLEDEKITKLAGIIGKDHLLGYEITEEIQEVSFQRSQLEEMTNYALEHDFELFQKRQATMLAEKETNVILGIYKNVYPQYMSEIESYIKTHEDNQIDYEDFIARYNTTLDNIDSPWYGSYVINLIFFKIYIPKEWFKGEYSGTRYMEDEKYQLFLTLVDRDKAIQEEKQAEQALKETVKTAYATLKTMEGSIKEMQENLVQSEIRYQQKLQQNQKGLVDFTELENARESLYQQQSVLYEAKIEYAKSLSAFNGQTAGFVNDFLDISQTEEKNYAVGQSVMNQATWHIKTNITDYNFMFGVFVPEEYDVDSYQLFYEGQAIGEKLPLTETLTHLSVAYGDTTLLTVMFYKGDILKYIAQIDGVSYDGVLNMQPAEGKAENIQKQIQPAGTWNLQQADMVRCAFSIATEQYHYDSYDLLLEQKVIGSAQKGNAVVTLHLYFEPITNLKVRLKKDGRELAILHLEENGMLLAE